MKFKVFKFKKVKSTNNTAIRIIRNSNLYYGMVSSETQSNGRGQYGKKWVSYKGNLFVSFFLWAPFLGFVWGNLCVGYSFWLALPLVLGGWLTVGGLGHGGREA